MNMLFIPGTNLLLYIQVPSTIYTSNATVPTHCISKHTLLFNFTTETKQPNIKCTIRLLISTVCFIKMPHVSSRCAEFFDVHILLQTHDYQPAYTLMSQLVTSHPQF